MAERVVTVRLSAQVADYQAKMMEAARATHAVGTETEKLAQKRQAFEQLGRSIALTGAALTTVTALSVKAAASWETAWTGVTKTVDGTPAQLKQVEDGLRDLTKVLPATHDQIAAVAEAAGQLGIETDNVVSFTKTMIDLGETTNLTAEQAAMSLAKFVNIMGTPQAEISKLGSALVGLGNNFATTESDILEMSMRLSKSGVQIGLSEGEVLGLATALSSVGIEAEAGGSAMSKVMIDIAASVEEGGERVQQFAKVSGMTADEFSAKWRTAPGEALAAFVSGLANAEAQGSSTLGVLADLGITEVRMRDALLGSAAASDKFAAAMAMGNSEFGKGNALLAEAEKRYATTESKITIAGNAVRDAAIDFGQVFLPAVGAAADGVKEFAGFMGDLPDPAQEIIGVLTGVVGVAALVGGTALIAVPKIAAFKIALQDLGITGAGARGALRGIVSFLGGPWGMAMAAATAATLAFNKAIEDGVPSQAEIKNALQTSEEAVDGLAAAFRRGGFETFLQGDYADQLKDLPGLLDKATAAGWRWAELSFNEQGALDSLKRYGDALNDLATTDLPAAQAAFADLVDAYDLTDDQALQLLREMSPFRDMLLGLAGDQDIAADSAEFLKLALGKLPGSTGPAEAAIAGIADEAAQAESDLSDMEDALRRVGETALGMGEAADRAQSALNSMAEAAKAEGVSIDGLNDASIAFRDSMRDVETAHRDSAQAILENGGTLADATAEYETGREAVIKMLEAKGLDRAAAEKWADTNMGSASDVKEALGDVARAVSEVPEKKTIHLVADTAPAMATIEDFIFTQSGRRINLYVDGYVGRQVSGNQLLLDRAAAEGGAIVGPGTGTSDSIPAWLSNGEHVLTAEEVRRAGGQGAVYRFRRALMDGTAPRFASGGAVTKTSADQDVKDAKARRDREQREYDAAKRARDATKKGSDERKKTQTALDKAKRQLDDAKSDLKSAEQTAASVRRSFRSEYADWKTGNRRGENRAAGMNGNGLSLVDQLLDIAKDTGGKAGQKLRDQALKSEKSYLKLEKAADRASTMVERARDKLTDLKDAAAAMASRVSDAVRSFFDIGAIGAVKETEVEKKTKKSMTVDGQTYSWYETETVTKKTKPTAKSILKDTKAAAGRIKRFADKLGKLAKNGLNPALLEEIALLGVEAGEPIADALLSATSSEISQINKAYKDIGTYSDKAGMRVSDANYSKLIEKAEAQVKATEKASEDIQKKLKTETDRIIGAITGALQSGTKKAGGGPIVGPGTGTSDDVPIWASNGEHVWTAAEVQAAGGHGAVARMRRSVLVPTSARYAYAQGGPVGHGPAETRVLPARSSTEVIQLVVNGRVLAETVREHDRSLS